VAGGRPTIPIVYALCDRGVYPIAHRARRCLFGAARTDPDSPDVRDVSTSASRMQVVPRCRSRVPWIGRASSLVAARCAEGGNLRETDGGSGNGHLLEGASAKEPEGVPQTVASHFSGRFELADGQLALSTLTFNVPAQLVDFLLPPAFVNRPSSMVNAPSSFSLSTTSVSPGGRSNCV
jgi:hypothetical protein